MTDLRKAAEMACDGWENDDVIGEMDGLMKALRQALTQEQEPVVGTKTWFEDGNVVTQNLYASDIYTTPPKREWVGLSHFERTALRTGYAPLKPLYHDEAKDHSICAEVVDWDALFATIEAKLKEKNT